MNVVHQWSCSFDVVMRGCKHSIYLLHHLDLKMSNSYSLIIGNDFDLKETIHMFLITCLFFLICQSFYFTYFLYSFCPRWSYYVEQEGNKGANVYWSPVLCSTLLGSSQQPLRDMFLLSSISRLHRGFRLLTYGHMTQLWGSQNLNANVSESKGFGFRMKYCRCFQVFVTYSHVYLYRSHNCQQAKHIRNSWVV